MKVREIFSLLVCCREVTYDESDKEGALNRKCHIKEEDIKTVGDLKKGLGSLKAPVQAEFGKYQQKVLKYRPVFMTKYPELMEKAQKMFDPKELQAAKRAKPYVVKGDNSGKEKEAAH